jgi:hypothetical protein
MLVQKLHLLRPTCCVISAGLLAMAGCSSSGTSTPPVTHPTMIEIPPESFLGDVPCASDGSGLKRYVATLFDTNYVAPGGAGGGAGTAASTESSGGAQPEFRLPSSGPTPCRTAVGFGFVYPERRYRFEVDGYDTDDLTPRALGSREMVDAKGNLVTPLWKADCNQPVTAIDQVIVRAGLCAESFETADPTATGSLTVPLGALLGDLRCGSEPGEVDHFEVSFASDDPVPEAQSVPCKAGARAVFDDLQPGTSLSAYVAAFSADAASAFAGASCRGRPLPGVNVDATCDALNQTGTLRVDLPLALAELGLTCKGADLRLEVRVPGQTEPQVITPPGCLQPLDQGFAPGAAALTITALQGTPGSATELGTVTCHADVTPGQFVSAQCEPKQAD